MGSSDATPHWRLTLRLLRRQPELYLSAAIPAAVALLASVLFDVSLGASALVATAAALAAVCVNAQLKVRRELNGLHALKANVHREWRKVVNGLTGSAVPFNSASIVNLTHIAGLPVMAANVVRRPASASDWERVKALIVAAAQVEEHALSADSGRSIAAARHRLERLAGAASWAPSASSSQVSTNEIFDLGYQLLRVTFLAVPRIKQS